MNLQTRIKVTFLLALFISVYSIGRMFALYGELPAISLQELPKKSKVNASPWKSQFPRDKHIVLFPAYFHKSERNDLIDYFLGPLNGLLQLEDDAYLFARYEKPWKTSTDHQRHQMYRYHRFPVFDSREDIHENVHDCHKIQSRLSIGVSEQNLLKISLHDMVEQLYRSDYYKEIDTLFKGKPIDYQFEHNKIDSLWFRFAGSSVYLEEYGVHFMVSRVVYSEHGERSGPTVSLIYGEVYDEEWNSIPNINLVVPTNSGPSGDLGDSTLAGLCPYAIYKAPGFVQVPIFQKSKLVANDCYGPEDPRITLVRNPRGYDEPVIVYNQNHRKLDFIDDSEVLEATVTLKRYRSMFQCFPWQFTRGRSSVDDFPSAEEIHADSENGILLSTNIYNRVVELRIESQSRLGTQKNWAPFVSYLDRKRYGYDKYIYYVYRWSDMTILRCLMYDAVETLISVCNFVYQRSPEKSIEDGPGPLRGGTNMINVNMLLEEGQDRFPALGAILRDLKIAKRQVWVGYARAHIDSCGCDGGSFYRPNFVAITRDDNGKYKVALVSAFVAYMINVPSWDLDNPDQQCRGGPSALIPNSILQWTIQSAKSFDNSHEIDDYLALLYSVVDARNYVVYIRGLLGSLVNLDEENDNGQGRLFGVSESGSSVYTNDNILCAIRDSHEFCKAYGKEHADQSTTAVIHKVPNQVQVEWEQV